MTALTMPITDATIDTNTDANSTAVNAILHTLTTTHNFDNSQIKTDSESLEHWGKDWT